MKSNRRDMFRTLAALPLAIVAPAAVAKSHTIEFSVSFDAKQFDEWMQNGGKEQQAEMFVRDMDELWRRLQRRKGLA